MGFIAKPGWFGRRKYSGWGATPLNWQGWLYIGLMILPFVLIQYLPADLQLPAMVFWIAVTILAFIDIMISLPKDERERIHEAIAERNALWAVIVVLTAGIAYQAAAGIVKQTLDIDPIILIALAAAIITKAISNYYLDQKD